MVMDGWNDKYHPFYLSNGLQWCCLFLRIRLLSIIIWHFWNHQERHFDSRVWFHKHRCSWWAVVIMKTQIMILVEIWCHQIRNNSVHQTMFHFIVTFPSIYLNVSLACTVNMKYETWFQSSAHLYWVVDLEYNISWNIHLQALSHYQIYKVWIPLSFCLGSFYCQQSADIGKFVHPTWWQETKTHKIIDLTNNLAQPVNWWYLWQCSFQKLFIPMFIPSLSQ